MSHSVFPCLVVSLPPGCAVMLSAVMVPDHIYTFSASWHFSASEIGACPLLPRNCCRLFLWASRATGFHLLGWAQIYHSVPSPPNMTSSFYFYSLLSVLAEVALSYWLPSLIFLNKTKKYGKYFKWSGPKFDPHMNWKASPVTSFKHTITDSWQKFHYRHSFFEELLSSV